METDKQHDTDREALAKGEAAYNASPNKARIVIGSLGLLRDAVKRLERKVTA